MKRFHPIGTVVTLIDGTKPLMIYGRLQHRDGSEEIFDYVACLYPEGHIDDDHNIFFYDKDVEHILFVGYRTPDDEEYQALMLEELKNLQ
ncbi:MAG: DUF4176 domain-containing protein [Defluviitaleaceae bacterium]|nr:DUF4176 domain-containing protein [Defluviitaleaceae bacterium]